MSDNQASARGVAHARPLTRRQQKLAKPQQKPSATPQPRPKSQPTTPTKTPSTPPRSRVAKAPTQPQTTVARAAQPQPSAGANLPNATATLPTPQPAPSAPSSRPRRVGANLVGATGATAAPTPSPAFAPTATPPAPADRRADATGSRKHPTLAVMTSRAPSPSNTALDGANGAGSVATPHGAAMERRAAAKVADGQREDTAGPLAMPAGSASGRAAPETSAGPAEPSKAEASGGLLHLPPRSRVETQPIAALDIMRRLSTRGGGAPDANDVGADDAGAGSSDATSDDLDDLDDLDAEGPPTLPTTLIPLRTYSRPLSEHSAGRRQGLMARFGRAGVGRSAAAQESSLVIPVAATHALVALVAALVAAALAVMAPRSALWALALALIAGVGAGLAFVAAQRRSAAQGALWLLLSELGMLAWGLAALGPRPALVALAVGSVALALRARGRTTATCALVGALTLYATSLLVTFTGVWRAPLALGALPAALLDAACVAAGLTLALGAMAGWSASRTKAEAMAQASQHEAAFVRRGASAARERTEADAERLARTLGAALQGRGLARPTHADGPLSPLAETINITAERIATLQRDREDRLRLEGALTGVLHAVERAWLGLSWSWPDPSGTPLDDLVALLRAPRPQDVLLDTLSTPSEEYEVATADDPTALDEYAAENVTADAGGAPNLVRFADDDHAWPDGAPDALLADCVVASAPSRPSFPVVEIHRQEVTALGTFSADDPAIASYTTLDLFDVSGPLGASAWATTQWAWPSWPDPWADEDDDPDDSASRHVTPPPIRRRWNEWSSQSGAQSQSDGRDAQAPGDQDGPSAHDGGQ